MVLTSLMGEDLLVDGAALYIDNLQVGRKVDVSNSEGQAKARAWLAASNGFYWTLGEWKMIPIENIIAACDGGPTKVAARISSAEQVLRRCLCITNWSRCIIGSRRDSTNCIDRQITRGRSCNSISKHLKRTPFNLSN